MEFVRVKYANNKLISADVREQIKDYQELVGEYVEKKGFEFLGFVPIIFGANGRPMEGDLVFRKKPEKVVETASTKKA